MQSRRISVTGGVEVAVDTWPGDLRPVLLVHGLASNARLWDGVAGALAREGHGVATLDQRGHGRSDRPVDGYDFATITADLLAVIDALGFDRPILAGQSWGGNVVVDFAVRHPQSTAGIVCVDGGWIELSAKFASWEACREALAPPSFEGLKFEELQQRVGSWQSGWPETAAAGTMANFERLEDGRVRPWLPLDRHMTILRELWDHHPSASFPNLEVPALLVPAGESATGAALDAAAAIRKVRTVPFPHAHHDVHAQHPEEVAAAIREAVSDGFFT